MSYYANNGSEGKNEIKYFGGELQSCSFTAPEGMEFKGWATSENGDIIDALTITENSISLYAVWGEPHNPGEGETSGGETPSGGEALEPVNEGLSGGAIAGIAIGSVAVAGLGGFAIFWFVIKKKSFAQLIVVIKGIFKK